MAVTIEERDASVLRYAGILGHPFCVVVDGRDGRTAAMEFSDRKRIAETLTEYAGQHPAVYQQVKRGTWRAVPSPKGVR